MLNFLRVMTGKLLRINRDEQVGLSRMAGMSSPDAEVDERDTQELWSEKQDILSRARNNKIGKSWQAQTLKARHQRESGSVRRQEERDKALQTGVWEIDTY